jgi:histidine triad (HIT) family protein
MSGQAPRLRRRPVPGRVRGALPRTTTDATNTGHCDQEIAGAARTENDEVRSHADQPALGEPTGASAHGDIGLFLGQVEQHSGERRLLSGLLAKRALTDPGADCVVRPDFGYEPGEIVALDTHNRTVPARLPCRVVSDDCLFCRIIAGEVPSTEVAASERSYAFRDINPQAPTHVLIVPRRHITNADTVVEKDQADLVDLVLLGQAIARSEGLVKDGVDPDVEGGYRLVFNIGTDAGNQVAHLHLHLIGGRQLGWPPG